MTWGFDKVQLQELICVGDRYGLVSAQISGACNLSRCKQPHTSMINASNHLNSLMGRGAKNIQETSLQYLTESVVATVAEKAHTKMSWIALWTQPCFILDIRLRERVTITWILENDSQSRTTLPLCPRKQHNRRWTHSFLEWLSTQLLSLHKVQTEFFRRGQQPQQGVYDTISPTSTVQEAIFCAREDSAVSLKRLVHLH